MNIPDEKQNSHARSFKINVIQQICPYFHLPKSQIWGKHWTLAEPRGFSSFFIEWIKFDLQQNSVKCLARLERQNKFQWRLSWWKSQLTAMNRAYYAHSKSAVYFAVSARAWQWLCRPVSTTHTLFMFPSAVTLVSSGCGQRVLCGAAHILQIHWSDQRTPWHGQFQAMQYSHPGCCTGCALPQSSLSSICRSQ